MSPQPKNPVKAGKTMIRIIEALQETGGTGVTDLSKKVDRSKSTVHNHLTTLETHGYVNCIDGVYKLSYKFLGLGEFTRRQTPFYNQARPIMENLAEEVNKIGNILAEERGQGVHLYRTRNDVEVNLLTKPGMRAPLHCTSVGKAILAYLPEERINKIFDEYGLEAKTQNTITDRDELQDALEEVREQGYALDDEENVPGLRCVGAPIVIDDEVLGSVSISGPTHGMSEEEFKVLLPQKILHAANVIELNLSHDN